MLKNYKGKLMLSSAIILLPMAAGLLLWNRLPETIPTHWGFDGAPNGWSSRPVAVFGMPLFLLAMHWLCLWATSKDRKNKGQSGKVFNLMFWLVPAISLFGCSYTYAAALGQPLDRRRTPLLLLGLLLTIVGNYLPKTVQNRTIGIKIKWTLENEANWNATHRLAGKLWVIGGLALLVCAFLSEGMIPMVLPALLFVIVLIPVGYSYWYSKRQR